MYHTAFFYSGDAERQKRATSTTMSLIDSHENFEGSIIEVDNFTHGTMV